MDGLCDLIGLEAGGLPEASSGSWWDEGSREIPSSAQGERNDSPRGWEQGPWDGVVRTAVLLASPAL